MNPKVDYSLFGPPLDMGPGFDAIGNAILAIQKRKDAERAAKAKAEADAAKFEFDKRKFAAEQAVRERTISNAERAEARHQTEGERTHGRDLQRIEIDRATRAAPHLAAGDRTLAEMFMGPGGQPQPQQRPAPGPGGAPMYTPEEVVPEVVPEPPPSRMGPLDPLGAVLQRRQQAPAPAPDAPPPQRPPMDLMDKVMMDRKRAAEAAGSAMGGAAPGAVEQAATKQVEAMIAAGMPRTEALKQYRQIIDAEKNRAISAQRVAKIGKGGGKGGIKPAQQADDDRALATSAHTFLGQQLAREDYKELTTSVRNTQKTIDYLKSDNPALHKLALGVWAKEASGPGSVQQAEREEFVNTVGGKDESIKKMALTWLSGGEVPEAQRKIFSEAATGIILRRQTQTLNDVRAEVYDSFATHPNPAYHQYADWAANRVGSYLLGKKGGAAGAPSGGGGGSTAPGGQPAAGADAAKRAKALELIRQMRGAR